MFTLRNVASAGIKLQRALECGGTDPVSGIAFEEVRDYLESITDDIETPGLVQLDASWTLRRFGFDAKSIV